ncbi:MAG TPA: hypothetical protein PK325_11610 [Cyclobacteriaceae bacterium]|nr:hypothetical protein [Cyclobacteriaceae bacterium]HMV11086.1 hypothetical protein [Cyclobacteriaceae bacterium]HMV88913.1 hypothetical protein [Cyclobacteriaceae bacterium]HMX01126.1 hypothetical protein [Cyclobacteriaceae bacterium]HMX50529.1 hypothetical protein [Cyclobacteriaceae bacterium]
MKKTKLIKLLVAFGLSAIVISCGDDGVGKLSPGFAGIASSYLEADGDVTLTIPFVNGSVSESDIKFDGSAVEGEDYEIISITEAGVEIKFLDDDQWEDIEKLRLTITSGSNGVNKMHSVTLLSNNTDCGDPIGMQATDLKGTYTVVTDDWEDFAPGDHVTIEAVDETHVRIVEYPGTTFDHHGLVLTIGDPISDLGTADISIESQVSGSYNASGTQRATIVGSGSLTSPCDIELTFNLSLPCCGNFNGLELVLHRVQ